MILKSLSVVACLSFACTLCYAQSPSSLKRTNKSSTTAIAVVPGGPGGPAPTNPWFTAGFQAGYSFNGGDFADNFQAAGRAILETLGKSSETAGIPIMGNLARLTSSDNADSEAKLKEIQQSSQGINVGAYPYKVFFKDNAADDTYMTLYVPLSYKLNTLKDKANETVYLNQGRFAAGIEFCFLPGQQAKLPTTLSIEPTISVFNPNAYKKIFDEEKSYLLSLEINAILPAGVGKGIMFNYTNSAQGSSQFAVGLVFVGSVK